MKKTNPLIKKLKAELENANINYKSLKKDHDEAARLNEKLVKERDSVNDIVKTILSLITKNNSYKNDRDYNMWGDRKEYTILDNLNSLIIAVSELQLNYAREDEGSLILQEQVNHLMTITRALVNDSTRPNEAKQEEMILEAEIKGDIVHTGGHKPWTSKNNLTRN